MIGLTLCSGIGAPEVAAPWVDWRLASEIEPFPRAVLQQRLGYKAPEDHHQGEPLLWGDMTEISPDLLRARGIPLPEIIVAGTPCQAFSIAGARKGLEDPRGNLTLSFVETCHAIVDARPDGKLIALWENVPGVLSDSGNAFGCFLGGIVGADHPVSPPNGGSWPGVGMVSGPRARAAWRVLDAQYFGVAQRRRRVFVVVDFGDAIDPAAVLFERQSLQGNSPPSREARQVAPTVPARSTGGGGLGTDFDCDGGLIASTGEVAHCLNAGVMGRIDYESEIMVAIQERAVSENPAAGPNGAGFRQDGTAYTLEARQTPQAVAFDLRGREGGAMPEGPHDTANLRAASGGSSRSYIAHPWAVRRLTPTECARLQGFPDEWAQIEWRNKPSDQCPDGPQYKAYGNSMAVPVVKWIMDRIKERVSM